MVLSFRMQQNAKHVPIYNDQLLTEQKKEGSLIQ